MSTVPEAVAAVTGFLLVIGLWTPIAGILASVVQLWLALIGINETLTAVVLGTLGVSIAMIGPGAWSIDARLFGRKHIEASLLRKK
jgi:putative oxidoreductase